jgi:hypothetical protein
MQLKSRILSLLNSIKDEATLKQIHDWLEAFSAAKNKDTFESGEIQAVKEGYKQYLAGNTISHKEASNRFEKWLTQKEK